MIDTVTTTIVETIDPLSLMIGLAFGVAADEAGRAMLRRMADERLNQILGNPHDCKNCELCLCDEDECVACDNCDCDGQ